MNLEIIYNNETYYISNIGNIYQGCLEVLDQWISNNPEEDIPISMFHITNLSDGYNTETTLGLSEILMIRKLSSEYLEFGLTSCESVL